MNRIIYLLKSSDFCLSHNWLPHYAYSKLINYLNYKQVLIIFAYSNILL